MRLCSLNGVVSHDEYQVLDSWSFTSGKGTHSIIGEDEIPACVLR